MRNKGLKIFLIMLMLTGAGIFLYPAFSGYLEHLRQAEVVRQYREAGESVTDLQYQEMKAQADQYNRELAEQPDFNHGAFYASQQDPKRYENLLKTGENGVMGSITIPKIEVELPVYHGTEEKNLVKGVGHCEGSSLPVGGESTHTVLSGHRGLPSADLFTRLDEVEEGDLFVISTLGKELFYRVDQICTVLPDQTEELSVIPGRDYATLVTCTPYGVNTHRLLIRGKRTEMVTPQEKDTVSSVEHKKRQKSFKTYSQSCSGFCDTGCYSICNSHQKEKIQAGREGMKKFIFNMIVLAAVLLVTASGVRASENDAVTLKVSIPDLNTSAEHVGIAVYQAAEPEIPGKTDKFVWIPSLNDIGITPEELDTAASVRETAEKLVQEVQKKEIPSRNAMTDQSGTVLFAGLKPGGYLITQTSGQETYGKIQNTLIFLPYTDESGMEIFYGEAMVKAEKPECPEPSPTSVPRVTVTPVEKNPGSGNEPSYHYGSGDQTVYKKTARTGDSTQILPVLILLIAASAALAALGIIIYKRRKKLHKDK